jgi:Ca2+-binding EF-hand superfamily protein
MFGLFTVLGVLLAATAGADETKKGKGKGQSAQTPEAIFKRLDTNGDGKLSRQEFRKLGPLIARRAKGQLKDKPQVTAKLVDRLFNRLDTNKDGFLSLEEFKKFRDYRRQLGPGAGGGRQNAGQK